MNIVLTIIQASTLGCHDAAPLRGAKASTGNSRLAGSPWAE